MVRRVGPSPDQMPIKSGGGGPAARPGVGIEDRLPEPDRLRRHFDQLILLDIGEGRLEREPPRRGEKLVLLLARGADIGELLALEHVDLEVVAAAVLAYDHALVDPDA